MGIELSSKPPKQRRNKNNGPRVSNAENSSSGGGGAFSRGDPGEEGVAKQKPRVDTGKTDCRTGGRGREPGKKKKYWCLAGTVSKEGKGLRGYGENQLRRRGGKNLKSRNT